MSETMNLLFEHQFQARKTQLSKCKDEPQGRISSTVSCHAEAALKRLAAHHGISKRAILESLITDAEGDLTQTMNAAEQRAYYDGLTG
jgi:hypothetical protein